MTGAFAYLMARTLRNRVVAMARRLRQPRYAIGFLFVIAYFAFMASGTLSGYGRPNARPAQLQGDILRNVAPALLALVLLSNWIGGSALGALAFTQAEVAMLFPAPVTRRALILLKVARAQLPILFNVVIVMVLWGSGATTVPRWLSALGLFTMFTTIHLHRLGAALVRVSALEHGRAALKRNWLSYVVGLVMIVTMGLVIISTGPGAVGSDATVAAFVARVTVSLSTPWVHAVLTPFALIAGPALARTTAEWGVAFAGGVTMLALHLWWVLQSHAAFEEAAAEQSTKLHAMLESFRKRGTMAPGARATARRTTLPLRPVGHPAVAIVWKNSLSFIRTSRLSIWLLVVATPAIVGVMFLDKGANAFVAVAGVSVMLALLLLLAGGMSTRNDLRGDLLNLSSIKTFPLRGRAIVLAEVSSSALPLAIIQCVLLWVAVGAVQLSKKPMPVGVALSLFLTLPLGIAGLNMVTSTIQNGVAVLFPGWVRLGGDAGSGGMEVMGQSMLGLLAMLLGFFVMMIVPTLATLVVVKLVHPPAAIALMSSVLIGAASLFGESYVTMIWLGRVLERTEPSASLSPS